MLPTHLAASLVLGLLLARTVGMDARAWMLALLFGVAIDVDHLFEVPAYLAVAVPEKGLLAAVSPAALLAHGGGWTSFFHEPPGAAVAASVALAFGTAVPAAFWLLHVGLDRLVARDVVPFAGPLEWALLVALAAVAHALARSELARDGPLAFPPAWPFLALAALASTAERQASIVGASEAEAWASAARSRSIPASPRTGAAGRAAPASSAPSSGTSSPRRRSRTRRGRSSRP